MSRINRIKQQKLAMSIKSISRFHKLGNTQLARSSVKNNMYAGVGLVKEMSLEFLTEM